MAEKVAAFVQNRNEFLSIWAIAHEWEGLDPAQSNAATLAPAIKWRIDKVILGYYKKDLGLRKSDGYRTLGQHWLARLLFLDKEVEKLWVCLTDGKIDIPFLDSLFVKRSEILHWCAKEFTDPPGCWALRPVTPQSENSGVDDDNKDDWYGKLTQLRKERVACLEVAKHLWEQNSKLLYEEVRTHPVMTQAGLRNVFTPDTFKTWTRSFAPDDAKRGGRRAQSDS